MSENAVGSAYMPSQVISYTMSNGELSMALAKAQAEIEGAKKDSENPHFRSKYADLASVWDAWQKVGPKHGLSIVQFGRVREMGAVLVTRLMHTSGQSIEGEIPLLHKPDMQGLGSALTYARRYGLAAMVGICPEDDDANAAVEPTAVVMAGPLKVIDVRSDTTASGKARYRVKLSDSRVLTTFKEQVYTLALNLKDEACEVIVDATQGNYGWDLKGLKRAVEPVKPTVDVPADTVGAF